MAGPGAGMQVPVAAPDDMQLGPGETSTVPHCPKFEVEQLAPEAANGWQVGVAIVVSQNEVSALQLKIPVPRQGPLDGRSTQRCDVGSQPSDVSEPPHCALDVQASPFAATAAQLMDVPSALRRQTRPSVQAKPLLTPTQGSPACAGAVQTPLDEQNSPDAQLLFVPHAAPAAPAATGVTQLPQLIAVPIVVSQTIPPEQSPFLLHIVPPRVQIPSQGAVSLVGRAQKLPGTHATSLMQRSPSGTEPVNTWSQTAGLAVSAQAPFWIASRQARAAAPS